MEASVETYSWEVRDQEVMNGCGFTDIDAHASNVRLLLCSAIMKNCQTLKHRKKGASRDT